MALGQLLHSLYINRGSSCCICLSITGCSLDEVEKLIKTISLHFAVKNLSDLGFFLGVVVSRTVIGLHLSQWQTLSITSGTPLKDG